MIDNTSAMWVMFICKLRHILLVGFNDIRKFQENSTRHELWPGSGTFEALPACHKKNSVCAHIVFQNCVFSAVIVEFLRHLIFFKLRWCHMFIFKSCVSSLGSWRLLERGGVLTGLVSQSQIYAVNHDVENLWFDPTHLKIIELNYRYRIFLFLDL